MRTNRYALGTLIVCAAALLAAPCMANNLVVTNVALSIAGGGQADIQFDLSWDNSWRSSWSDNGDTITVTNWDAAWVFVKFRRSGQLWHHVMLTTTGHTATGGTAIDVADDGGGQRLGAFVYRSAEGSGSTTCTAMRLRWDYAASGLAGTNEVDLAVFAVEMVYIPEGPFSLGSGGTETYPFYRYPNPGDSYVVTGEQAIVVGTTTGNLYYAGGGLHGSIPAAFPKGFRSFYCMKHEITQGQYADFLNLLDSGIVATYFPNANGLSRHTIAATNEGYAASAPDLACNYLNGDRALTYLDWCGLRPMTEFEFEKACRGVRTPWINEYAWGDTTYVLQTGHDGADLSGTETAVPTNANLHGTTTVGGPVRVGIYATATSSRQAAGAGYFGNMELSGNLFEVVVSVSRTEGLVFGDVCGDGNEYTPHSTQWPVVAGRAYTLRGGSWRVGVGSGRGSDRTNADSYNIVVSPSDAIGVRGVRSAP